MTASQQGQDTTVHRYDSLDYVATEALDRDKAQSRRLHEPDHIITSIDPITGRDIDNRDERPYIVDGNVVMYFESEETRRAYLDTPIDHPVRLPDNPYDDGEAEG
jgi:hypothetical protein